MQWSGVRYAMMVDQYSGWPSMSKPAEMSVTDWFTDFCSIFSIPVVRMTEGGPEFMSMRFKQTFMNDGVHHIVSTPNNPHTNCRAELGVKTMKRMIRENIGSDGNLRTSKFVRAMLQYKNTPSRNWGMSPAECIFGRALMDYLPITSQSFLQTGETSWSRTMAAREQALEPRYSKLKERWSVKKLDP